MSVSSQDKNMKRRQHRPKSSCLQVKWRIGGQSPYLYSHSTNMIIVVLHVLYTGLTFTAFSICICITYIYNMLYLKACLHEGKLRHLPWDLLLKGIQVFWYSNIFKRIAEMVHRENMVCPSTLFHSFKLFFVVHTEK